MVSGISTLIKVTAGALSYITEKKLLTNQMEALKPDNNAFLRKSGSETSFAYLSNTITFNYSSFKDLIILGDSYSTSFLNHDSMVNDVLQIDSNLTDEVKGIKNWPTHLIKEHPINVYNFAVGGAPVDHDIIDNDKSCYSMTEQYEFFNNQMTVGKKYSNWTSDETLMTIWFGINDVFGKTYAPIMQKYSNEVIDEMTAKSMFNIVNKLYDHGLRNFLFMNVPPMDKFPIFKDYPDIIDYVIKFNNVIQKYVENFQSSKPDTNVFIYNAFDEVYHIMENKYQYNIIYTDDYSKGKNNNVNPDLYFWRDDSHLSNYVQSILTKDLDKFLTQQEKESKDLTGYNLMNRPPLYTTTTTVILTTTTLSNIPTLINTKINANTNTNTNTNTNNAMNHQPIIDNSNDNPIKSN
ncbi:hypothetical protein BCR32DRAFT_249723 [Anaeromyces robustus]|uniref:SGNH hydrolase n=1 Tax=Anaeromyces robustus TaxID=1754192 RepID=A0A1Y1WNW2_9FUNG|nr:hypothetical protein BCR32DRAFT_249723 [Anaeromyces robustus]|eukprot:ORX75220.1 hypothetical protein BCR32DRAFT_249723 [Anaeromyces robustus]